MIQQHYYTRDRKGIYSNTPGYDTVAKSINLEDDFIIKYLHPLCFYEAPAILAGEEDIRKYPKSLFCINAEDNKMIIGQSVFAGKDYTGKRNRYFTHNYIVSGEETQEYIENPQKIIYLNDFIENYNIDNGETIPQVTSTNCHGAGKDNLSIDKLLNETGIDELKFKQLIVAAFHGALYKKKIYIILDCELNELNELSKKVLMYIYTCIPFEIRRKIGFTTYMKEPKNRDFINIMFLPKGSIKRLTTEIKAGYVFDFAHNNFYLEDMDTVEHPMVDFAVNNLGNMMEFFKVVDKLSMINKLNINEYDKIISIIKQENVSFNLEHIENVYKENSNKRDNEKNLEKKLVNNHDEHVNSNNITKINGVKDKKEKSFERIIKRIKSFCHI